MSRRLSIFLLSLAVAFSLGAAAPAHGVPESDEGRDWGAQLNSSTTRGGTIYPHVVDGFKDKARIEVHGDFRQDLKAVVYNGKGKSVRKLGWTWGNDFDEIDSFDDLYPVFTWNGRNDKKKVVPVGAYTVTISATVSGDDGQERSVSTDRTVKVARGVKDRKISLKKAGTATSSRKFGRDCYINADRPTLEMACWEGTQAEANWTFAIPVNARKIRYAAYGDSGWNVRGKLTISGKRTSKTRYVVSAKVTNWRSEYFDSVTVTYRAKVKV